MAILKHKEMLRNLLPPGMALMGEMFDKLIEALSVEFSIVDQLAKKFLEREIPGDLEYQLDAWEKIVGLPDEFSPIDAGIESRNIAVVRKLSSISEQSNEYWTSLLRSISSSDIELKHFQPLRAGFFAGDYVFDDQWIFAFQVTNIKYSDLQNIKAIVERSKQAHIATLFSMEEN